MTPDESQAKREAWVIDYLYGELDDAQKKSFEQALEHDAQLRELYEQQTSFDELMPIGSAPEISYERMQGVRWSSLRNIKQGPKPSLVSRMMRAWQTNVMPGWQMAAMVLMFVVGFGASQIVNKKPQENIVANNETQINNETVSKADIVAVRLDRFDVAQGNVVLTLSKQSTEKVQGNIENAQVRHLLTQSLNRYANDDVRLQLTEFFSQYVEFEDVQTALIYTLKTDPNPGVRYNAVENLVKTPDEPKVRAALIHALVHDNNPGIRVEAFLALSQRVDETLQEILATYGVNDANTFIRERSKRLLLQNPSKESPKVETQPSIKSTNDPVSI